MRRLAALLALLVSACAAAQTPVSLRVLPTANGAIDSNCPTGVSCSTLTWAAIPNVSVTNGASGSVDLRTYLTEPGSPNATISIGCTGGTLPTGGFSYSGSTLTWATSTATSLTCTATATRTATPTATSLPFTVASAAAAGTTPPIPTLLTAVGGAGNVVLSWDAVATATSYTLRDGSTTIASPTQTAASPTWTTANVGSISSPAAPTVTPSGNGITFAVAGTGFEGTSDQFASRWTSVTGRFTASLKVTSLDAGDFSKVGFDIRESQDANSKAFNCVLQRNASGTTYLNSRNRATTAGSRAGAYTGALAGVVNWVHVAKNADGTWRCGSSTDGNAVTWGLTSHSLSLPSTVFLNVAASSTQAGASRASVVDEINVTTASRVSYTYTTASAVTATVRANAGSSSAYGASVAGAPTSGGSTAIRFRPGHYAWVDKPLTADPSTQSTVRATHSSQIADICSTTYFRGVQVHVTWASLESGSTPGDYTAGFAIVDGYRDQVAACGKYLMLVVHDAWFGSFGSPSHILPAYLLGSSYGAVNTPVPCTTSTAGLSLGGAITSNGKDCNFTGGLALKAKLWEAPVADRLIALAQAYGARYKNDTAVELFLPTEESAVNAPTALGYSSSAFVTQFKRIYAATRAAWPNTGLRAKLNYLGQGSEAQMADLIAYLVGLDVVIGGSDVLPLEDVLANRVFGNEAGIYTDFRGVVPFAAEIQSPEFEGPNNKEGGPFTPATLFNFIMDGASGILPMRPQYFIWYYNTWAPLSTFTGFQQYRWSTGIKPFVETTISGQVGNGTNSTRTAPASVPCPTGYPSCTTAIFEPRRFVPANDDRYAEAA